MSNLRKLSLTVPHGDRPTTPEAWEDFLRSVNDKFTQIAEQLAAQAGHGGVVKLAERAVIDLQGGNVINSGRPRGMDDLVTVRDLDAAAGPAALKAGLQNVLLDPTLFPDAEDLFDLDPPGASTNLSLRWQKKGAWVARWEEPTGVLKVIRYYISFFNDAAGTVWMNPETGATVASQALSERAVEEASYRTGLSVENLDVPFSTTGVKVRVVAEVKIKGVGKTRGPAVNYGSLVPPFGDGADDTAEATAVQNLTLVWGAKKKGFKATWQPPASHWDSKGKYYRVVYMNNAATHFMNPLTGALASPDTEAGGTIKVVDTHHTTHLTQDQLASDFAAGVKVKVTPVNTVNGVETISTNSSTSSFVAPNGENTAAPPAVNGLALTWGAKKKGFKGTWAIPSSQWFGEGNYYLVVYFDNAAANFMHPSTGALSSPNTEAGAQIKVYDTHHTTHLLQSQLASQFASGVKLKVTPVNFVGGVETVGTSSTTSLVAPSGENIAGAGAVNSLDLVWGRRKKGFKATWAIPSTNWNGEGNYYKVAYSDSAGSNWMNPHDGTLAANEAAATIKVYDTHHTTHLSYTELATQFQTSVKVKVTPVNFVAGVETDGTPSTSSAQAPGQDVVAIATGVPVLPMGIEYSSASSGSGHTSTTFVMDSGASAFDDTYNGMHIHWSGAGNPDDRIRLITDYVASTKTATVAVAWVSTPSGSQAFEVHRGATLGEKSGTGHDTTHVVLGTGAVGVDDAYNGYTLMMPSANSGDVLGDARVRRVTDYVGATKTATLEFAVTSALGNNDGYLLWQGYVGYENSDQTGKITGVCARIWGSSTAGDDAGAGTIDTNIIEPIAGTGDEWYTVNNWLWTAVKKSTGVLKKKGKIHPDNLPLEVAAPGAGAYTPMFRLQAQNTYRIGGSDGKSALTYYFAGNRATGTTTYSPDVYTPPDIDIYAESNWPL